MEDSLLLDSEKFDQIISEMDTDFDKKIKELRNQKTKRIEVKNASQIVEFEKLNWLNGLTTELSINSDFTCDLTILDKINCLTDLNLFYDTHGLSYKSWDSFNSGKIDIHLKYKNKKWVVCAQDIQGLIKFIEKHNIKVMCNEQTKKTLTTELNNILKIYKLCFDKEPLIDIKYVESITL